MQCRNKQIIHDSKAEVEVTRLKAEKAREKVAQLKLALREKRGQAKGCSISKLFVCFNHVVQTNFVSHNIAVPYCFFFKIYNLCPIFSPSYYIISLRCQQVVLDAGYSYVCLDFS